MTRLNLGAGKHKLPDYVNIDIQDGRSAYPLNYQDCSVDEIRASHLLEHFSHRMTLEVLKDWARVLKPGGVLKVAVPNFDYIVDAYENSSTEPFEAFLMGGQINEHDVHLAIFNEQKLRELLSLAGFEQIEPWQPAEKDCASLPVSLNLQCRKPEKGKGNMTNPVQIKKVVAAMSVPRLGFMDNFFSGLLALGKIGISVKRHTGAFWEQCIERCFDECLADDPDAILSIDYDTIFTSRDVQALIDLMNAHPEADAIAALQASRTRGTPLFTVMGEDGKNKPELSRAELQQDLMRVHTAHFGLTLIRASSLRTLPRPWFWAQPNEEKRWGERRIDADISFWRQWHAHNRSLFIAPRVVAGHAELMIRWPDINLETIYQQCNDYWQEGKPENVWK